MSNFRSRPPDLAYGWWQSDNEFQFIMAIYLTLDLWFIIWSFWVYFYCLSLTRMGKFSVRVIVWLSDSKTRWPKPFNFQGFYCSIRMLHSECKIFFYFIRLEFIELITSDKLSVIVNHINASLMLVTDVADGLCWWKF